jgi:hypothetical protein
MNTVSASVQRSTLSHNLLALIALLLVIATVLGLNERFGVGDSTMFWALFLVGMTICAIGPLGRGATYGWWNPLHIAGYVLGTILLLLGAAVFFDIGPTWLATPQTTIFILAALIAVKGVLAMFYRPAH